MQKDLAKMLGITPAAINKSINGSITFDKLGRIAAALDVPIADLIDDPSSPPKVFNSSPKILTIQMEAASSEFDELVKKKGHSSSGL